MNIDVHHHFLPREFFERMGELLPADIEPVWTGGRVAGRSTVTGDVSEPPLDPRRWFDVDTQLREMDAAGIDHAVLSAACYQDWMTADAARVVNDGVARVVADHPDRFSGMISVPPDQADVLAVEIDRARDLGLCAINLTTTHRGRYPDHPDFAPLFALAADRRLPVYIHPSWRTPLPNMERWDLERAIGKPTDLTLCVANLMFSGTVAAHPDLRVLFAHLGGSLMATMRRLFYGQPGWLDVPDHDYPRLLERVFVDTAPGMWWSPAEIEGAAGILGAERMLLGSDYPLSNDPAEVLRLAVSYVDDADLPEEQKRAIRCDNAIALFGLHHLESGSGRSERTHVARRAEKERP